jgi:DNA-binding transcriptional regulator YhcF (GntR family)
MQLWFAHRSGVTIREQLVTQIILGILCGDLPPGERLPSTRELARRFRLHPNTISAGYRQLAREHWLEFRRGSGVYVRNTKPEAPLPAALALDQLIANLFRSARELQTPLPILRARLRQWLDLQPPDHFLLIEPDEELRRIVALEMQQAVAFPVKSCAPQELHLPHTLEGAIAAALPSKTKAIRQALPAGAELLTLNIRSVPSSLAEWLPAPTTALVAIASRWPDFLQLARTMLIAAGFHPDGLLFRDSGKPNWQRGLKNAAAVVCDSATAAELTKSLRAVIFPLLAESSLQDLRHYQNFVRNPVNPQP